MPSKTLIFLALLSLFTSSFSQTYDPITSLEMLTTASASYCNTKQLTGMSCGATCSKLSGYTFVYQFAHEINANETLSYSMFVNPSTQRFVTAFRGSHGKDQISNEILHSKAITYDLWPISNAVAAEYFYKNYKNYLRQDFLANIAAMADLYQGYQFFVTGHSLGGALASLAVIDINYGGIIPKEDVSLYTYGSPRVGDYNLAQAIVDSVGELYRVTHYKDMVPHVPLCVSNVLSGGACIKWKDHPSLNGALIFNAWHTWPEVFYQDEASTQYKVCKNGEDQSCSGQFKLTDTTFADHVMYLGQGTRCLNNGMTADSQ